MERAGDAARSGRKAAAPSAQSLPLDETRILKPGSVPEGARFKGYEDFIVQDLVIKPRTVLYRRERWLLASGETIVAALPKEAVSHFGPNLKRLILSQYHQGQITIPRLAALLAELGIDISKRQIVRLLSAKQDAFLKENIEVAARRACFDAIFSTEKGFATLDRLLARLRAQKLLSFFGASSEGIGEAV